MLVCLARGLSLIKQQIRTRTSQKFCVLQHKLIDISVTTNAQDAQPKRVNSSFGRLWLLINARRKWIDKSRESNAHAYSRYNSMYFVLQKINERNSIWNFALPGKSFKLFIDEHLNVIRFKCVAMRLDYSVFVRPPHSMSNVRQAFVTFESSLSSFVVIRAAPHAPTHPWTEPKRTEWNGTLFAEE